ncbi:MULTISPECIES: DUF4232 domain-containing protein [Streptomyces]|uniref:DUF4232 domain-containing protein n=1 Tax=Streptomyces TaxID=1883 RepID=UPI0004BD5A09|nr:MULTISPECIES: DUF4232 domain-containing protein [Streptomyces]KOU17150.1 hypothetical protein ADK49_16580 [Streptomyces sp. WM6349]KOU96033.1 hypothetical protein ADK92_18290 [Streptomyces sp. XY533]KOV42896.1 hypothetical protein ADK98_22150 [Streptomyces sp. H036]
MSGNRRKASLVTTVLVGGAMLLTACQDTDAGTDAGAPQTSPSTSATAAAGAATPSGSPAATAGASGGTGKDNKSGGGTGGGTGGGQKPVGQVCGANDIAWSTKSETQAGGYILVVAKAKPGISCTLPAVHPTVAFGSDGTEAGPAEQSAGKQITLSGDTAAYAGVNPKTTSANGGKELDSIIVAIGHNDPDPVSLPVGTITVDKPVVTNWHTSPKDAVPSR